MHFVAASPRRVIEPARVPRAPTAPLSLAALARPIDRGAARASFVSTRLPLAVPPPPRPSAPPSPPPPAPPPPASADDLHDAERAPPAPPPREAVAFVAALLRFLTTGARIDAAPPAVDEEPGRFALIEVD